ncbi:protein-tyrosine sulfotransferase isoform X2 [Lactuca sativa]|uniref:protein-tyrosine sulfotransferase isoform X2 n=1 Tax=Lactuca sativa TaxID=4236 RepID=UPI000CD89C96|nr:protein-tyrosine sulfotransferase isoform X2 [Lactuca sativa]
MLFGTRSDLEISPVESRDSREFVNTVNGSCSEISSLAGASCQSAYEFEHCENTVKQWASSSLHSTNIKDGHILKDLLFFLHVPRTGGRTYFYCFLKKLYSNSLECPRSYDKLRFDPRKQNCKLFATHDDYSIMSKLPREKSSVVTILRNPIDRVFSAYEFSIEVAARFLVHPNLTSATKMSRNLGSKKSVISTLDIWPWKYLVPWMREELFSRRDARRRKGPPNSYGDDSYNMEEIVTPLHEFINHPVALDLVHNGATFQIAGLTNNSNTWKVHDVRHCVMTYQTLGNYVLQVAKRRLDDMLYVGLTEEHKESATMFANFVGAQVISQLVGTETVNYNKLEQGSLVSKTGFHTSHNQGNNTSIIEEQNENMSVGKLMETYETCVSKLRSTQSKRRMSSLRRIFPANFTKEARRHVPEEVLKQITLLNSLDVELYKHAEIIFEKQHQKLLDSSMPERWQMMNSNRSYIGNAWEVVYLSVFIFLVLFIFLYVKAKRRISKLKI